MKSKEIAGGIELTIPRVAPSFNKLKGMHWAEYKDLRQTWRGEVMSEWAVLGQPGVNDPVEITYVRSYWSQPLDFDNMLASFKPIGDALSPPTDQSGNPMNNHRSILPDDDPEVITSIKPVQEKVKKKTHPVTKVIIEEGYN